MDGCGGPTPAGRVHALFLRTGTVASVSWRLQVLGDPAEQFAQS
jgi:hypothetical protein